MSTRICLRAAAAGAAVVGAALAAGGCGWTARDDFLERRQVFIQARAGDRTEPVATAEVHEQRTARLRATATTPGD